MPVPSIPQAFESWGTFLPSADTLRLDAPGVEEMVREGLHQNAASLLGRVMGQTVDEWGLDESLLGSVLEIFSTTSLDSVDWLTDLAFPVLEAVGVAVGVAASTPIGWLISGVAGLVTLVVNGVRGQDKYGRPLAQPPDLAYSENVDQDFVRGVLKHAGKEDLQAVLGPPEGIRWSPYPRVDRPDLSRGGQLWAEGETTRITPGGLAYYGIDYSPIGNSNEIAAPRYITPLISPSVTNAERQVWLTLLGNTGMAWSVDTDKLIDAWLTYCGQVATTAPESAMGKIWLGRNTPSRFVLALDLPKRVRDLYVGHRCLIETVTPGGSLKTHGSMKANGWHPVSMLSNQAITGYQETYLRHAWIPVEVRAVEALLELKDRQSEIAKTTVAAWARPGQPGFAQFKPMIESSRLAMVAKPQGIDVARIQDPPFRLAIEEAQKNAGNDLAGAVPAAPPWKQAAVALPGVKETPGGGGGLALIAAALALGVLR